MNGRREQTARDSATQLGHITSITEKCQTHRSSEIQVSLQHVDAKH